MGNQKLKLNTISSLSLEVTTIISGFLIPRLIIGRYGSDINGLVNSITQFIGVISFLELGVGKVVQSSLYKPLVERDYRKASQIVVSASKFFRQIARGMLLYIAALIFIFPRISESQFGWAYSGTLIATMSVSLFSQYYFGIVNSLLLAADQKGYVQYIAQTLLLIANTLSCVILIRLGVSIHIVKLATSLIFLARPIFLALYVRRRYPIDYGAKYETEPIPQKWNGLAQHVAYVVLNNTDVIILTTFATFSDVSVYSAYYLVVSGVKQLFMSMMNGVEAYLGNLWAKQDTEHLKVTFGWTEWVVHTGVVFTFGCTGALIVPFIRAYTNGVTDANYIQPGFAALLVTAHACHCLRLPYNLMIFAAGHYRQTQRNYIIAATMNVVISILCVREWGLVGVALGTLISMAYQTVWMAFYNARHLAKSSMRSFVRQCCADILTVGVFMALPFQAEMSGLSYISWLALAVKTAAVFFVVSLSVNLLFYRKNLEELVKTAADKFRKSPGA